MAEKVYKVVVVGMGKRGKNHAVMFRNNPRFELAGICDIDNARLEAAAKELGNPRTSTDAAALAKELKPDIFCFCTLPNLRLSMVQAGIASGAKMIAYEKPVALSFNEGKAMMEAMRKAGVKSVVSHQHRYGKHYAKVKEIADSGVLGRVQMVYGTATGWMAHMMSHMIDYSRWYNGNAEATWVMASAAGKGKFKDVHTSPDYIGGFIQFANGVRGVIETGAGAPDQPEVEKWWGKNRIGVQGTEGFAECLTNGGWRAVTKDGVQKGEGVMAYDADMPFYIADIAKAMDDPKFQHPCDGEQAYKGFEIMMAMMRSAASGGQVALPLAEGPAELELLQKAVKDTPVLLSSEVNRKEFFG